MWVHIMSELLFITKACWETKRVWLVYCQVLRGIRFLSVCRGACHELNISWSLLTQSQQRDKDKPAVRMDTPRSGYILLGVVSDQYGVSSSLRIHSSKEWQVDWLYKSLCKMHFNVLVWKNCTALLAPWSAQRETENFSVSMGQCKCHKCLP